MIPVAGTIKPLIDLVKAEASPGIGVVSIFRQPVIISSIGATHCLPIFGYFSNHQAEQLRSHAQVTMNLQSICHPCDFSAAR
jgi:hypothetical protein